MKMMAGGPVAIPEVFIGDGKQSWSDWVDHFDSVADVYEWDEEAKKKWIRARLIGRAATAFRRLSEADRATFDKIVAALTKRIEPECRKELYVAEFQRRRRRRNEDWVAYGDDLKTLVERAYPTLQVEAQELLALNQFLAQIENQQVAFAVRQRAPMTVDAAVASVLELETYLDVRRREDEVVIASAGRMRSSGDGAGIWSNCKVLGRMEKPERLLGTSQVAGESVIEGQDLFSRVLGRLEQLEASLDRVAAREGRQTEKQTRRPCAGDENCRARDYMNATQLSRLRLEW